VKRFETYETLATGEIGSSFLARLDNLITGFTNEFRSLVSARWGASYHVDHGLQGCAGIGRFDGVSKRGRYLHSFRHYQTGSVSSR
jgi:hypothetical protein